MPHRTREENVAAVLDWRRRTKLRLIEAFGGKCGLCGYNRSVRNLAFHHLDPSMKEGGFGQYQSLAWAKVIIEVRKCVMLCANCHGEVHDGLITDLTGCPRFDETFATDKLTPVFDCVVCGHPRKKRQSATCSHECSKTHRLKLGNKQTQRPDKAALSLMLTERNCPKIAADFGVTSKTVRKWAHAYGLTIGTYVRGGPTENRTQDFQLKRMALCH